ncbi:MAG TPA: DUF4010 domain-containing protein [Candidatus Binatia bacterium]|nr:DUF4010 domain-containing protein [Candidatus Binatia bacterium]
MTPDLDATTRIAVATLVGAAVGVERQWSGHAAGRHARFGGIRTFTLLGATAGIAAQLWLEGFAALATVVLASAGALVVAAYVAASRRDVEATTEVAGLIVLAAGTLAGLGHLALASAVIAVTAFLLVEKSRLHSLVQRLDDAEVRAGARFAVMAAVVLPLLPAGPYGPGGAIRPRELWALVLVLSGVSFLGYVARRAIGPARGDVVAGLLGGIVSSTSVTLAFARASRGSDTRGRSLALGAVGASTIMFARLALVAGILNPALGIALARLLSLPLVGGAAVTALGLRQRARGHAVREETRNPLQVVAALEMAALFQVVLLGVRWAQGRWGAAGMLVSGALLGLADTDALALSIAKSATLPDSVAVGATAVAIGGLSNTLVKLGIALAVGRGAFRWRAGAGLALLAALAALAIVANAVFTG